MTTSQAEPTRAEGRRARRPRSSSSSSRSTRSWSWSILLFVAGAILKPDTFPTWDNVRNMLTQASVIGVLAIGMTFVIATAGIDLSVGSMVAAAGVFGGVMLVDTGTSTLLFIVGALAFATALGTVNAISIAYGRVVPSSRRSRCSRSPEGSRCC